MYTDLSGFSRNVAEFALKNDPKSVEAFREEHEFTYRRPGDIQAAYQQAVVQLAQKAGEMCADMRVMFITGFAAVTLKAGRQMPNARVLSKPFHLRDLVMEVDRLFETDQAGLN